MPIYEYQCSKCHKIFEEWVKSFDSPEHEPCPECGGDAARIVSNTTFVLKGSGWYVTEYGNQKKDHESGAGAPGEGQATASDSETTGGESASKSEEPAAKAEAPAAKGSDASAKGSASPKETASAPKESPSAPAAKDSANAKSTAAA